MMHFHWQDLKDWRIFEDSYNTTKIRWWSLWEHLRVLLCYIISLISFCSFIIIFNWLCCYIVPIFPPLSPSTQFPPLPEAIPTTLFMSMGHAYSSLATPFLILCFTSPWLFCNHLFVLVNPLTSSPIPLHPLSHWQLSKWFRLSSHLLILFF